MKEEQNASSSANYDVELLHPAAAHDEMFKNEHAEGLVIPSKEGLPIETAPLKWCTPKSSVIELHNCSAAYRICPVDVNSRPSSCLTNFLLSGRAVMLEQPRRSGAKVISHMLTAHGGEIFIHSIPTARSLLEDPPSIIEGSGGRVTDYRITAFGDFMKFNRLAPCPPDAVERLGSRKPYIHDLLLQEIVLLPHGFPHRCLKMFINMRALTVWSKPLKAIDHLERSSRFWPLTIGETIIFNVMALEPLPELLEKKTLTDDEVLECKKAVYRMVGMEKKNDPLPVPATGSRGKGPKRDEQYRQLWAELEVLASAFVETSENHRKVLECVLDCKNPADEATSPTKRISTTVKKEEKHSVSETDASWQDIDRYMSMSEREKKDALAVDKPFQGSPPKKMKTEELSIRPGGQSLLSLWTSRQQTAHNNRGKEFDGWMESGGYKAKLYIHLDEQNQDQTT